MENEFLTITNDDLPTSNGEGFKALEDGLYEAACAGIVVKEMQNFDKTGVEDKIIFLFQIKTEDGFRYLQSQPMKKSIHEKATLWKLLAKWTKQKDAKTLIEKMGTDGKFDIKFFIGKPIQLTVESEEVGEKTYNRISGYMAPKKGAEGVIADAGVPEFVKNKAKSVTLADGLSIKVKEEVVEAASEPKKTSKKAPAKDDGETSLPNQGEEDDSLPFN